MNWKAAGFSSDLRGYIPPVNNQEKIFQRRVSQMVERAQNTGMIQYSAFLSLREQELAIAQLNREKWNHYLLFGGYEGAERKMLCVFEQDTKPEFQDYPITCLKIEAEPNAQLTHRDYLGALLGLKIQRGCTGDIIITGIQAMVYLQPQIAVFIQTELSTVGRYSVQVTHEQVLQPYNEELSPQLEKGNASSMRLDAVLAAMMKTSRSKAAGFIAQGLVQINHRVEESVHFQIQQGDIVSVRGIGRFQFHSVSGRSRKNRFIFEYVKQ